jgi:hypothetical protein
MRLLMKDDIVTANKARKPQMKDVRGKTWQKFNITLDGKAIPVHLDTTWGQYFFFEYKKEWYACRLIQWKNETDTLEVDPSKSKLVFSSVEKFQRIYKEAA